MGAAGASELFWESDILLVEAAVCAGYKDLTEKLMKCVACVGYRLIKITDLGGLFNAFKSHE